MISKEKTAINTGYALKGALILSVLLVHSISMINSIRGGTWRTSPVNIFFTSFTMPMFILVSGYYLGNSLSRSSAAKVALRRTISVGSTILCWEIVPTLIRMVFSEHNYDVLSLLRVIISVIVGGRLWYLYCYLFCSLVLLVIVGFTKRFLRESIIAEVIILCVAVVLISICGYIPGFPPFFFPYFVVGYFIYRYSIIDKEWFPNILRVCTIVFILLIPFYTPEISFYVLSPAITSITMLPQAIFRLIIGFAGGGMLYAIVCWFIAGKAAVGLENLGKKSLALYVISMYVQEPIRDFLMRIPPLNNIQLITDFSMIGYGVIFCVILIGVCILIDKLLMHFKPLYKILLS